MTLYNPWPDDDIYDLYPCDVKNDDWEDRLKTHWRGFRPSNELRQSWEGYTRRFTESCMASTMADFHAFAKEYRITFAQAVAEHYRAIALRWKI